MMIKKIGLSELKESGVLKEDYLNFINSLKGLGFKGDLNVDYADRVVLSTDNSIYQVLPQGILYPKDTQDLVKIAKLANQSAFSRIAFTPRGGGTGTNGQALTDGFVVDISKHMNSILEINAKEGWVLVQAGVVKDQLNQALRPHGLFFAPELSTSNRATLGGMINTDASGQGSVLYGKTRDHVLELLSVFTDGSCLLSKPLKAKELEKIQQKQDAVGRAYRVAHRIAIEQQRLIKEKFPKLNRCLTGYDLAHLYDDKGQFNLNSLLCGSEGSLAFIAQAKLNVLPIPKYQMLVCIQYPDFQQALTEARQLMACKPSSIETIDDKVLHLAQKDIIWETVAEYFPKMEKLGGINFLEYLGETPEQVQEQINPLLSYLKKIQSTFIYTLVEGQEEVKKIWAMRKKAVGLLGNTQGEKRPIPFVEDTVVPPENLADFIQDFRNLLDSYQLEYGMFGHVDAGVLHVRPALDMKDNEQALMIRKLTDQVVLLVKKYKGLLWGEHGKGLRSEYAPEFFGSLYPYLQEIKEAFDPNNQLNPGKIATPKASHIELLKIDQVPTRGSFDQQIAQSVRSQFFEALYCNGNGACFNFDPNDSMCPSWKATRDRKQSPKGRSALMREWLRLQPQKTLMNLQGGIKSKKFGWFFLERVRNSFKLKLGHYDFNHQVFQAMSSCLACKSCTNQCPIKVDVPEFRSKFLNLYHSYYLRPIKDYLVASLEFIIPLLVPYTKIYNGILNQPWLEKKVEQLSGMVHSPKISPLALDKRLKKKILIAKLEHLNGLSKAEKTKSVILVQDVFTRYFETALVIETIDLLNYLGFKVYIAPYSANGKPLHVQGMREKFIKVAIKNAKSLFSLYQTGIPLVGIEPAMTLIYRQEYEKIIDKKLLPQVLLVQEWLSKKTTYLSGLKGKFNAKEAILLNHCTEKTSLPSTFNQWQKIFNSLGIDLKTKNTGCCGMSGTFGHEKNNLSTSEKIYQQSWKQIIEDPNTAKSILATGYSCRSQAKRFSKTQLLHPLQWLYAQRIDSSST